jgi:quercetin dioxygenase-like cupin family protein
MLTARTSELDLLEAWLASDPEVARAAAAFPINRYAGSESSAVVYFELEPRTRLPRHTDSAEEILYIVAGEAEAEVGEERGRVQAGDLAVIPAMVPHGVRNTGDETLKVVGFFSEAEVVSTFEEALEPLGVAQLEQGAPAPA